MEREWSKSIKARMALVMTMAGVVPIVICHLIVFSSSGSPLEDYFRYIPLYIPLLLILLGVNWFLSDLILRPITQLLTATTKLVSEDIRQRLEVDPHEPLETLELRKSFNKLLNRLEESLNIQCQFVADASHELRTPLTSIQGYTKLLLRRGGNIDANLLAEALQTISDESGRLIRLVSDLLQLARADAGQAIINQQEVVDLRLVLTSVEDTVMVIAPEQIEVQFIIPPTPIYVFADSDRLKQVFLNLTNNAIKATQAGGKVTVTLRFTNNQAIIRVIDTGIGIAPADQQRIFDRFYRVERSRTRSRLYGGGTGLGLAIALTIIKAHGGAIELESELNKGSTFTVRLPVTDKDDKSGLPPAALTQMTPSERRNNERIAEAERKNESAQPQPQSSFAPEPSSANNVASIGSSSSSSNSSSSSSNLAALPAPDSTASASTDSSANSGTGSSSANSNSSPSSGPSPSPNPNPSPNPRPERVFGPPPEDDD
ncbi:MAG: Histidine kinase [Cyanobacteriota bacterium erpe_2018_sw_21hr_WHONDRS-SW48-000092_B_bin.40]|nr:Histidine kinase [Cyanobacteriota bacterium erpe_2018_sw_21hr_WHONDRS-SW48-000092_B_bin.40]